MRLQFRNPVTGQFVKGDTTNLDKAFTKFGSNVIQQARQILSKNDKGSSRLSSNLSYNLKTHKSGLSFSLDFGSSSDYWEYVDEGVQGVGGFKGIGRARGLGSKFRFKYANPGGKLVKALKSWKGLGSKNVWAVGYSIKQKGLTRTQFITKPIKEQYKKLPNDLTKAFALDIERLLDKAIPKKIKA